MQTDRGTMSFVLTSLCFNAHKCSASIALEFSYQQAAEGPHYLKLVAAPAFNRIATVSRAFNGSSVTILMQYVCLGRHMPLHANYGLVCTKVIVSVRDPIKLSVIITSFSLFSSIFVKLNETWPVCVEGVAPTLLFVSCDTTLWAGRQDPAKIMPNYFCILEFDAGRVEEVLKTYLFGCDLCNGVARCVSKVCKDLYVDSVDPLFVGGYHR